MIVICPFSGPLTPEHSVGRRRRLFGVSLEYLLAVRTHQRLEFVALKAGMARIRLKPSQSLTNRIETLGEAPVPLQLVEGRLSPAPEVRGQGPAPPATSARPSEASHETDAR